ncbi:inositol monophosphatase family protein [Sphingomonas sp. SUN039]|uniref:inositol monophosphatase family protein n=1 Tax=Sphingomonas sp. SUN039 TaxID=2937787 RepID=UPI00216495A6|nr:inositol monophosphatase family protein [Sphingomonas sp. SUN039]UVO55155.1 histidinol phosphate phosphatase [Sphingomonas sp. SUN039]
MRPADVDLAERLADAAGAAIRPFFRSRFDIETKADASPVTEADRAAEAAMRRIIEAEYPRDGIIGEEYGVKDSATGRSWVLDPIDGTVSFMAGRPIFGTLVALVEEGWPVIGVIDQPVARERWVGVVGRPTLFNGKPATSRRCPRLDGAKIATTSPHLFNEGEGEAFLRLVAKASASNLRQGPIYGGDCYNYGLVASGHIDLVVEAGLKLHDYAALVPVVEGAGGTMCDWAGDPLNADSAGDVIALGDPARLEDAVAALAT